MQKEIDKVLASNEPFIFDNLAKKSTESKTLLFARDVRRMRRDLEGGGRMRAVVGQRIKPRSGG
jgi:hypothetical protein